jgi:hypothetical protein
VFSQTPKTERKIAMKKLLLFIGLSIIAFCCHAQIGEIIVTEFDPPLLIQGDDIGGGNHEAKITIDIDGNSEIDYEISFGFDRSGYYLYQVSYSNTRFREVGLVENDTIIPYEEGTSLPLFGYWTDWSVIGSDDVTGDFYDKVGICKVVDGELYYGWIHRYGHEDFSFPFTKRVAVDKMAFCTIPNYPLGWGQTSITDGVEDKENIVLTILHPNPTTGLVTITGQDLRSAEVFNTLGQKVATARGEGETMQIDLSELPIGVYFVNITNKEGRKCVRKVVKE